MLNKTITKFSLFVILFIVVFTPLAACHLASSNSERSHSADRSVSPFDAPQIIGTIDSKEITESSGIAVSKCSDNVFWTHNDSGGGDFIFALNEKGKRLGTWRITGAKSSDLEDIASYKDSSGNCFLYVGDIGNNGRIRSEHSIYRIPEPQISTAAAKSDKKSPMETAAAEILKFNYADLRHDAETLMVHPQTGDIYVLTKRLTGAAGVYKIKPDFDSAKAVSAEKIADLSVPAIPNGFLTSGDISPDGKHVVICDYFSAYELLLPDGAADFDKIWQEKPVTIDLGVREQGEAVSFGRDSNVIFATSEKKNSPLIEVKRKKPVLP